MKKYILLMLCVMNITCYAEELIFCYRPFIKYRVEELEKQGFKILRYEPWDSNQNGYCNIIYE